MKPKEVIEKMDGMIQEINLLANEIEGTIDGNPHVISKDKEASLKSMMVRCLRARANSLTKNVEYFKKFAPKLEKNW